jgi:hypothetical protein
VRRKLVESIDELEATDSVEGIYGSWLDKGNRPRFGAEGETPSVLKDLTS